jgi:hypothetical protein
MRNISDKSADNKKAYILLNIFFFENRDLYEIMWGKIIQPDRPHDNLT